MCHQYLTFFFLSIRRRDHHLANEVFKYHESPDVYVCVCAQNREVFHCSGLVNAHTSCINDWQNNYISNNKPFLELKLLGYICLGTAPSAAALL